MENPKSVHRFLLVLVGVFTVVALGLSIYFQEFYIFLGWLAVLGLSVFVCGVLALFNVVIFAPIFWLVGKLSNRRARRSNPNAQGGLTLSPESEPDGRLSSSR